MDGVEFRKRQRNIPTTGHHWICFDGTSSHSRLFWHYETRKKSVRRFWISLDKDWPSICLKVKTQAKLQGYYLDYQCLSVRGCENRNHPNFEGNLLRCTE